MMDNRKKQDYTGFAILSTTHSSSSSSSSSSPPINSEKAKHNEKLRYFLNQIKLEYPNTETPSQLLKKLLLDYKNSMVPQCKAQEGLFKTSNTYLPLIDVVLNKNIIEKDSKKPSVSSIDDQCAEMLETFNHYFEKTKFDENSELSALLRAFMFYYYPYQIYLNRPLQVLSKPDTAIRTLLSTDKHMQMLKGELEKDKKKNAIVSFFSTNNIDEKTAIRLAGLPMHFRSSIPFLNQEEKSETYEIAKKIKAGHLIGLCALHLDEKYINATYQWAINLLKTGSSSQQQDARDSLKHLIKVLSQDQLLSLLTTLFNSNELIAANEKLSKEKRKIKKSIFKLISSIIAALSNEKQLQLKKEIEAAYKKAAGENERDLFYFPEMILWLPLAEQANKIKFITTQIGYYLDANAFYDFLKVLENVQPHLQTQAINDIIGHILYSPNYPLKMLLIKGFYKEHNPFINKIHKKVVNALLKINISYINRDDIETFFLRSENNDQMQLFNKWCEDLTALPLAKELFEQIYKLIDFFIDMTACFESEALIRDGYIKLSNIIHRLRVLNDPYFNKILDNVVFAISHSVKPIITIQQIRLYLTNNKDEKNLTQDELFDFFKDPKNISGGLAIYTLLKKSGEFGILNSDADYNLIKNKISFLFMTLKCEHVDILEILLERKKEIAVRLTHFKNLALFEEAEQLPPSKRNTICQSICANHLELQLDNTMLTESISLLSKAGIYLRYDQVMHLITTLGLRLSAHSSIRENILLSELIHDLFSQKHTELLIASHTQLRGDVSKIILEYAM